MARLVGDAALTDNEFMKLKKPKYIAEGAIYFIAEHAKKNKGTITELAERLSAVTGETIYRQSVEGWLSGKIEPKLGIGLLLIDEGRKIALGQTTPFDILATIPNSNSKTGTGQRRPKVRQKTAEK